MAKSHSLFRRILQVTLIGVGFCVFGAVALAASGINRQINYQGRLLTSGGSSVSNGTYLLTLSLYDASSGGNRLWTAAGSTSTPSAINVTVQNGLFSIQLGDTGAGQNPFTFDFNQDSLYLGVTVASDTEMVPRKRLTSVPYAFVAESLQGQFASSSVANTGGNLFALRQGAANAASGDRSALFIQTSGTSNVFDYLIKGNSGSDVFTVSRQGNVTTTGNFADAGNTILGDSPTDSVVINAHISSDLTPTTDAAYSLGTPSLRWLNVNAVNVSSTNVTTTNLSVNGQTVCLTNGTNCPTTSSTTPTFDQVTTAGNTTTNEIVFGGGTSTGIFETDAFVVSGGTGIGDFGGFPTKLLSSSPNGNYWTQVDQNLTANTNHPTSSEQWAHYVTDEGDFQFWAASSSQMFYQLITSAQLAAQGFPQLRGGIYIGGDSTGTPMTLSPFFNNYTTLGDAQFSWEGLYVSGTRSFISGFSFNNSTGTNATTTNSFANRLNFTNGTSTGSFNFNSASGSSLFVTGQAVCLANGTNCPASAPSIETDTLLSVTNRGSVATATLALYGGATMSNLTVTGTTSLQNTTATNFFATNTFFTNSVGTSATTTNSFSTNFGATNATIANLILTGPLAVSGITWTNATGTNTTSTNLFATNFGATTGTITNLVSTSGSIATLATTSLTTTNATATTQFASLLNFTNGTSTGWLGFNVASGSALFVQGQAVCLQNGTNCPAASGGGAPDFWSYNVATDTLYPATSTSDVLIGGATQGSSAFSFVTSNTSSRFYAGAFGSSTDIVLGASTSSISNIAFQLAGGSFFANANIGSASSIYTNAAFIAGPGSTMFGDGYINKTNGSLNVSSSANVLFNQNGNVGIHLTAPSTALDVSGNIRNVINSNATFTVLGTLRLGAGTDPLHVSVAGTYAYVANSGAATIAVVDVTNPALPFQVGTSSFAGTPSVNDVFAAGRYAYAVTGESGTESLGIIDISNPSRPVRVATTTLDQAGTAPQSVYVSGKYAYVVSDLGNEFHIIDISSASSAPIVSTTTIPNNPARVVVQGRYAYTLNSGDGALNIIDVANPTRPVIRSTFFPSSLGNSFGLAVSGRYAYTVGYGSDALNIIDISNPSAPIQVATSTLDGGGDPWEVVVSGRYAFVSERDSDLIAVVDVSVPTAPVHVTSIPVASGSTPVGMAISGRYLYVTSLNDRLTIIDIGGTEVAGLVAASASIGSLQVLTNGSIANQFAVGGGLSVGAGGIFSAGSLAVYATNTTSTFSGPVTIQGQRVCLSDGTNCPVSGGGGGAPDFWSYNVATDTLYPATSTSDVLIGGATQGTSAFDFLTSDTSSRLYVGAFGSSTDIVLGGPSSTVSNTAFQLNGGNLFVNNNIGAASSVYTNAAFIAGPGSTMFGDGYINKTNGAFTINSTSGDLNFRTITSGNIVLDPLLNGSGTTTFGGSASDTISFVGRLNSSVLPAVDGAYTLGTSTLRWLGVDAMNVTSTNIVTNNLTVNGNITVSTTAPTFVTNTANSGYINVPQDGNVVISGKYAYVPSQSTGQGRFAVVDISNPGSATSVGELDAEFGNITNNSVVILGKYAYVGSQFGSISIVDISNPAAPARTNPSGSNYFSPSSLQTMNDLAGSGKYLYAVGSSPATFNIIDTASSTQANGLSKNMLSVVATYTSSTAFGTARGVVVQGPNVYVVANNQLTIMDVSNPATTTVKGMVRDTTNLATARYAAIQGKRLYVAAANRLTIMDVSNVTAPTTVGALVDATNLAGASRVAVSGNTVYVTATTNHKVVAIDVSDPTAPRTLGIYTDSVNMNSPYGIAVNGNRIYVSHGSTAGNSGLAVLGISGYEMGGLTAGTIDVSTLRAADNIDIGGSLNVRGGISSDGGGILTTGGLGVLGSSTSTINGKLNLLNGALVDGGSIIHALNNNSPSEFDLVVSSTVPFGRVRVAGRYMYAVRQSDTFAVYDISTTSSIAQVGAAVSSTALGSSLTDFAISGRYAFVIARSGSNPTRLTSVDISDPLNPTIVSTTSLGGALLNAQTIEVKGNYAFVVHSNVGANTNVSIWDISNPAAMTLVRQISHSGQFGGTSMSSALQGNYLYVGGNSPAIFTIVNISNPLSATNTGSVAASISQNALAVRGKWAFAESNGSSFQAIDISSSTAPTIVTCNSSAGLGPVALSGNYGFVASNGSSQAGLSVIDITNPGSGTCTMASQQSFTPSGGTFTHIAVAGRRMFISSSQGLRVITMAGLDVANANIGSIYGDSAYFTDRLVVNGQGYFTDGLSTMGDIAGQTIIMRGTGTSTFNGVVSSSQLYVGGQLVCLANGTNCPVSGGGGSGLTTWSYNASTDSLYPASSTSDVLIGGATQGTSAFSFLTSNTSSRLYVGAFGSSTNIVLGGPSSTISNTAFQLDGNDLFVAGNIGSASSVYTNGAFIAGPSSTIYGDGFITKTNGSLSVSSSANILFNQNGNVGIHNTSPQEALDVTGGIRNVLAQGQPFSILGRSAVGSDTSLSYSVAVGNHLYAVNRFDSPFPLVVYDITNSTQPVKIASVTTCLGVTFQNNLTVVGNYAYVLCDYNPGPSRMQIFDVSNPAAPTLQSTISLGNSINLTSVAVNGRYAYVTVETDGTLRTVDISDPANPSIIGSTSLPGASPSAYDVKVSGRYAYVVGPNTDKFWVLDLIDPATPVVVGDLSAAPGAESPISVVVQGRYAYTMNVFQTTLSVIDVSDPANPSYVTTTPMDVNATYLDPTIVGNYLIVSGTGGPQFYDISSSTNPVFIGIANTSPNDSVTGISVSGKRILVTDESVAQVTVINMPGVDTAGLRASNAELGTLSVLTDAGVGQNLYVGSNLTVGNGGISSAGSITVQGKLVCLADGTNCPVSGGGGGGADSWSYNVATDSLRPATATSDVLIGGATQGTSAFSFLTSNTSSRLYVGAFGSSTNIVLGGSTSTISNTAFQLDGNDLFVAGNIGSASSVYTNGAFIAGPGSTMYGDGYIARTTGDLAFSASSGVLRPATNNTLSLGSVTSSFANIYSSGTMQFVNASGSALELNKITNVTSVGSVPISGTVRGTAISGRYAYIANTSATSGIVVADIADPKYPIVATSVNLGTAVNDIAIQGSYAYVGSAIGFHAFDIRNPSSPSSVGFVNVGNSVVGVAVSGKYAYLVEDTLLNVIDISNPANLKTVATLNLGSTVYSRVYVQGAYLYAIDEADGTQVFDIIDPTRPILLDTVPGAGDSNNGSYVSGKYLYVGAGAEGLQVVDVSNPYNASVKSLTPTAGNASDVTIVGKLAYIADTASFTVFNIASSTNPTLVSSVPLSNSLEVTVSGKYAYVGRVGQLTVVDLQGADIASAHIGSLQSNQLTVLDTLDVGNTVSIRNSLTVGTGGIMSNGEVSAPILNVNKPQLVSRATYTTTTAAGVSLTVSGHYGYAAMGTSGMQIFDLMQPDTISPIGSVAVSSVSQIAVSGKYAYTIHTTAGLYVFDVQNPSSPTTTGRLTSGLSFPSAISVSGKYAYVAVTDGLAVVDISNPSNPYVLSIGNASPTGSGTDIYVDKGYAYVGKNTGMTIFDVSNPAAVTSVAAYSSATIVESINVSDGYAYLVKRGGTVEILNVTNPASPTVVGTYAVGAVLGSSALGGRYLYTYGAGLNILDVLNPSAPTSVAQASVSLTGRHVALNGRYLYTIASTGLQTTITTYDLGGADIANAGIGSLQAGAASVDTNLVVGNDLIVRNGLRVGSGGIYTDGTIAAGGLTLNSFSAVTSVATVAPGGSFDADTIDIQGKYAYITDGSFVRFRVYDITQPNAPTVVTSSVLTSGGSMDVAGRYAYVTNNAGNNALEVVDISNPSSPMQVGAMRSASSINDVVVSGNYAYAAASAEGLRVIDISDPTTPTTTGILRNFSNAYRVRVQGRYAYVYDTTLNSVKIVDTSSSTSPTAVSSIGVGASTGMAVRGKYFYSLDSTYLRVIDVSDPTSPTQVATSTHVTGGSGSTDLILYGNYAVLGLSNRGVQIFDISNPSAPTSVKYLPNFGHGHYCSQLRVVGRYLYGACTEEFSIADLGGATFTSLDAGSISTDELLVARNVSIGNNLEVGGGITAGMNGIHTDGELGGRSMRAILNDGFATGTAGLFYKSVASQSLPMRGIQTGITAFATGTAGSVDDLPDLSFISFGNSITSAGGFFVNGYKSPSGVNSQAPALLALDMTSSTVGGAILAARACDTASNTNIMKLATDADSSRFTFRCSGQFFADSGTVGSPADYAEYFPTADTSLTTGEVVVMTSDTASSVKRGTAADRESVVGVISEHPLVLGNAGPDGANENNQYYKIVGLLGQLPVKVSSINGPIMAGDKIMAGDDGYGVKATGVGAVLGQALENLTTATGSIKVYVKPEWSGDGIFDAGHNTTNIASQGTATGSAMTFDSFGLTFQGSAWNTVSSTAITSSFTFVNDVITATSSVFRLNGTLGNSLLTISDIGDVGIAGDLTVGHRLFLGSKAGGTGSTSTYLFVDDTQAPTSSYIATNADGWSTATTYDYAERFPSKETLEPGDLVVVDPTDVNHVKKTVNATDIVMGIVSTKPGFITGAYSTGTYPIALAGRVPTRVSTANGTIAAGDELAPSSEPGVAVKAVGSGPTIGIALENYGDPAIGKISVFVNPGWKVDLGPANSAVAGVSARTGLAKLSAGATSVDVTFANLNAYPLITLTPYGLPTGQWGITNVTDHGFTLNLSHAESFDLIFSWKAEPSGAGATMSFSDGTNAPYDPLTGASTNPPSGGSSSTESGG